MKAKSLLLASAAAALFASAPALAADEGSDETRMRCDGVNSCKGKSDCSTTANECAGQNSCKGKGFRMLTPEECEKAQAEAK